VSNAIEVSNLSKLYVIGERERYKTLRDVIAGAFRKSETSEASQLWALKDLNFNLEKGKAYGIVGANGAGKSTLLKILSRITDPTSGRVVVRGRLGSLLEVGTGFHPELTGRENIFLSGIILGMKHAEIKRRFDEIVAFAEVDRFIDTPVKHYSSGMYVRLAFSVAAHLDVDVLAVDEVLAVGDASFQKKCLGKMEESIGSSGRTVLFVSHNLGAIRFLTHQSILLKNGRVAAFGPTEGVVNEYLREAVAGDSGGVVDLRDPAWRRGTTKAPDLNMKFEELKLLNGRAEPTNVLFEREPFTVETTFSSSITANGAEIIYVILNFEGAVVFSSFSGADINVTPGRHRVSCRFDPNILRTGNYRLRLYLRSGTWQDVIAEAATFKVETNPAEAQELSYATTHPGLMGLVRADYKWTPAEKA
jgi:lipopolysaccharide transport system ATP-binding protein